MRTDNYLHHPSSTEAPGVVNAVTASQPPGSTAAKSSRKKKMCRLFLGFFALYLGVAVYQTRIKPLPVNISLEGETFPVAGGDVEFLYDVTGMKEGQRVSQQVIFDRALKLIREAQDFVLVDVFLFNEYLAKDRTVHRKLCQELCSALLEKKQSRPDIHMVVITDPVNEAYGGPVPEHFKQLRSAGIPVILTDLRKLRDSNPVYSSFWRMFVQWFGTSARGPLPHPFAKEAGGVSLRSWLTLLNFKANHRKLVVADAPATSGGRQMTCLVMSANPHDASSVHGNVGLLIRNGIWRDLLRGEQAILAFSGSPIALSSWLPAYATRETRTTTNQQDHVPTVRVLTEAKIRKHLLQVIESVGTGDTIDMGMFYLSERSIIKALVDAAQRGAAIRLLLDPNRDAFGYQKNGIPNRPVAAELVQGGGGKITVRWYDTHGEQFHTKLVLVRREGNATLFAGSANLTRRNIGDFNLETDVVVTALRDFPAIQAAQEYFDRLWGNQHLVCSAPYETYGKSSSLRYWKYRFQEWSGISTF
jgi:phosphatidylserine/phosphatidylglycerophosphate/cardiolipin synthase-like enzyme